MTRLEELRAGALIAGLAPDGTARVVSVEWHGDQAAKVFFESATGQPRTRLVYRSDEPNLSVVRAGRPWKHQRDDSSCCTSYPPEVGVHPLLLRRVATAP